MADILPILQIVTLELYNTCCVSYDRSATRFSIDIRETESVSPPCIIFKALFNYFYD